MLKYSQNYFKITFFFHFIQLSLKLKTNRNSFASHPLTTLGLVKKCSMKQVLQYRSGDYNHAVKSI